MAEHDPFRISGKDLGALSMPGFCRRCFWLLRHAPDGPPFQIPFPGIFSSIDSFTKRVIHQYFDSNGKPPRWLASLGGVKYIKPPPFQRFRIDDAESQMRLTGAPDGILVKSDGSLVIVDYKTAKHSKGQDRLFPMYATQLNAYAHIAERLGLGRISGLALVYFEPVTTDEAATSTHTHVDDGFRLGFVVEIVPVPLQVEGIPVLLSCARKILDMGRPPPKLDGCENCSQVQWLVGFAAG